MDMDRAKRVIAHGALTNSKRAESFVMGVYPTHLTRGVKCYTWDDKGNKYIDYICALGTNIVGYRNEAVLTAAAAAMRDGHLLSLPTVAEVEFAEVMTEVFPFMEALRVLKSGSQGCTAAIKMARAYQEQRVLSEDKTMWEMWKKEKPDSISQRLNQKRWVSEHLQELRQGISHPTRSETHEKRGSEKIRQHSEWKGDGSEVFTEAMGKGEKTRKGQGLLRSETQVKKTTMLNVWKDEAGTCASRGLQATVKGDLGVSATPRGITSEIVEKMWLVLSEGYHGHEDEFISLNPPGNGIPTNEYIAKFNWSEVDVMAAAAVIIEPVMLDASKERIEKVRELRDWCDKYQTILIFDETITGLRFPGLSFSKYSGIYPDICVLGKALANGFPISVVGGKRAVMEADYFVSSTFAGDTVAMAAALKTIELLKGDLSVKNIWDKGTRFLERFNALSNKVQLYGYSTRSEFRGEAKAIASLWQEACRAGILFGKSFFYNAHHHAEEDFVIETCGDILKRIERDEIVLQGELPASPFAAKVRNNG